MMLNKFLDHQTATKTLYNKVNGAQIKISYLDYLQIFKIVFYLCLFFSVLVLLVLFSEGQVKDTELDQGRLFFCIIATAIGGYFINFKLLPFLDKKLMHKKALIFTENFKQFQELVEIALFVTKDSCEPELIEWIHKNKNRSTVNYDFFLKKENMFYTCVIIHHSLDPIKRECIALDLSIYQERMSEITN